MLSIKFVIPASIGRDCQRDDGRLLTGFRQCTENNYLRKRLYTQAAFQKLNKNNWIKKSNSLQ